MGNTLDFAEDLLTEAVIKYADTHDGKVKATEVAKWASENIDGLQGVRYYHFTRPVAIKDPKTGKKIGERKRVCKERMDEINEARSLFSGISEKTVLLSSSANDFFRLSHAEQINAIMEMKKAFSTVEKKCAELIKKNDRLEAVNKACNKRSKNIDKKIEAVQKEIKRLDRKMNYLMRDLDKESKAEKLAEIGISDGTFDPQKYLDSLRLNTEEALDMNKTIAAFFEENTTNHEDMMNFAGIRESILEVFKED